MSHFVKLRVSTFFNKEDDGDDDLQISITYFKT